MNILITICARGGSKGIPKKNIKLLNGLPLIAYTIKVANEFCNYHKADIALSTDNKGIKDKAEEFGLKTSYVRPGWLATDSAGKIEVIEHLMRYEEQLRNKEYDYIIDLDVSSPLRTVDDVRNAFNQIIAKPDALNVFSVNPASKNPYFNMVEASSNGFVKLVKSNRNIKCRQDAPLVYDMNASFYIFRKRFFQEGWEISTTNKSLAYVMNHICFDLDTPKDFRLMELLMSANLLDMEL